MFKYSSLNLDINWEKARYFLNGLTELNDYPIMRVSDRALWDRWHVFETTNHILKSVVLIKN